MKVFRIEEFVGIKTPNPGKRFRQEILMKEQSAENLGGISGLLPPGTQVPYHFHNRRESVIIAICGEATEIVEGKDIPIKANEVLFIPAGEKHATVNRTGKAFRYLEFFTCPPVEAAFIEVK